MSLSVVIITMNEERHIGRLLSLLQDQSLQPDEVIVADNQSTDRTREIARKMGAKVVDGGLPGAARNLGAAVATGEWILFLDADAVLVGRDVLLYAIEEAQQRQLDICGFFIGLESTHVAERFGYWVFNQYVRFCGAWLPHAVGTAILVRRSMHEYIGGFDEDVTVAEDMDYARRAGRVGRFGLLKSVRLLTPARRIRKEGRFGLIVKLIQVEWHMLVHGPIKDQSISWDFDHKA